MRIHETFMKKENRDTRFKELKAQGYKVMRTSDRNQLLHPMYVKDYPREISQAEKGFGNTIYKTHFSHLYNIEEL